MVLRRAFQADASGSEAPGLRQGGKGRNAVTRGSGKTRWRGEPARLVALVWLVAAMLAMPIVASAQLVAARIASEGTASRGAAPENGAAEVAARQALRAVPVAELRFLADRTDAKPLPAGPDPFLPATGLRLARLQGVALSSPLPSAAIRAHEASTPEARAPPAIG